MSGPRITRMDTKTGSTEGLTNRAGKHSTLDTSLLCVSTAGREAGSSEPASASFGTVREYENFQLTNRGGRLIVWRHLPCPLRRQGAGQLRKRLPLLIFMGRPGRRLIERRRK